MNRSGDQGWLVVVGLGLLLVCAVIAVVLQGQQVSEANENLDVAHVTLTAYADERDAVATAAGATLGAANDGAALIVTDAAATQAGLANQQATVEAEITALAEDFAVTQTQSANTLALLSTQQSVTVLEAQNSIATVQAEATAEILAGQAEATTDISTAQAAARNEAFSIAASTSRPAFENFATAAAATQAALQAEVTELVNRMPTIDAQQTLIADYEQAAPELVATFAPPTATQTIQQQTAPISVGGELIAQTFEDAAAWEATLADTAGQAVIEDGALVLSVAEGEMRVITLDEFALENALYAEIELTMRDCTAGAAGLAFNAPEDAGGYLFTVSCALDAWTIAKYDASGTRVLIENAFQFGEVGATHRLGVAWQGSRLTLYLDGSALGRVSDSTFTAAQIGAYAIGGEESSITAQFDNLRVWSLP